MIETSNLILYDSLFNLVSILIRRPPFSSQRIFHTFYIILYFASSTLLELIWYEGLRIRLPHLFVALLYYVEGQQIDEKVILFALHVGTTS